MSESERVCVPMRVWVCVGQSVCLCVCLCVCVCVCMYVKYMKMYRHEGT